MCDQFGEHIWLSLIGPELEAGAEIREAGNQESSPASRGPITAEAAAEVVGRRSVVTHGLAIVLYIQSLSWMRPRFLFSSDPASFLPSVVCFTQNTMAFRLPLLRIKGDRRL